ncbi:MAG: sulfotransferase [Pseudomonadota bacterium]
MDQLQMKRNSPVREGPDFIGVGPEKTGTTWIDRKLRSHPSVDLCSVKELRYFWECEFFPGENFFQRLKTDASWHRKQYVDYLRGRFRAFIRHPRSVLMDRDDLVWDLRYLFKAHDDDWYRANFTDASAPSAGEVSPQYFFLPEHRIHHVQQVAPNARIIVSLRRPADWIWSFVKMIRKSGHLEKRFGTMERFIETRHETYNFSQALANWIKVFGHDQVLVLIYDELLENPERYFTRICEHLGIDLELANRDALATRVNVGESEQMPKDLEKTIQAMWQDDMRHLSDIVPGIPVTWIG